MENQILVPVSPGEVIDKITDSGVKEIIKNNTPATKTAPRAAWGV